jgi:hypothetical protein
MIDVCNETAITYDHGLYSSFDFMAWNLLSSMMIGFGIPLYLQPFASTTQISH